MFIYYFVLISFINEDPLILILLDSFLPSNYLFQFDYSQYLFVFLFDYRFYYDFITFILIVQILLMILRFKIYIQYDLTLSHLIICVILTEISLTYSCLSF